MKESTKRIIYKYPLDLGYTEQNIEIPEASQILDIQLQGETPVLWALVDPKKQKQQMGIEIHMTGHEIDTEHWDMFDMEHVKTLQIGAIVYHFFAEAI